MPKLRKYAAKPESAAKIPIVLAELGVRLVVVEDLPRTRIDGAAFFLDGDQEKPVIALSMRLDRMESFWHTLGHELRHIINRDPLSLDSALVGENRERLVSEMERKADLEAASWLVPESEIKSFALRAKPWFAKELIIPFAGRMGVHPCIVVGRLQHAEIIGWDRHADLRPKIREHVLSTATCDGYGKRIS
jgi:HTH-type transcriptional regulator / antitoxin HigA